MYSTFWKVLWCTLYVVIIAVNIAFTFNIVSIFNPTSIDYGIGGYENYYFGMSSVIDAFKTYFKDNSLLDGYLDWLRRFTSNVSKVYSKFGEGFTGLANLMGWKGNSSKILQILVGLVVFATNLIPQLVLLFIGLCYIIFIFVFALEIVLFIISLFGGAYATPLPSTEWWNEPVPDNPFPGPVLVDTLKNYTMAIMV